MPEVSATVDHLATRLAAEHHALATRWLERLQDLLPVDARHIFPTRTLLDHIPDLILEIAKYLRAPAEHEVTANTAVMAKAAELGELRFGQRASVHQVLREYEIFGELIEAFFADETQAMGLGADPVEAVQSLARANRAVRTLQQQTVNAFISRYAEHLERRTAQLRNFSRFVSHEIRQPLGVLQVLSRVIPADEARDPETARLVRTLERNVVRLGDIAGKLERLSRLTRTEGTLNEQTVDLGAICADVAAQLAEMAVNRDVAIHVARGLPSVRADAGQVELVLVNLIANAIKYSDPEKAERRVDVDGVREDGRVRLTIRDNGLGIPVAKQRLIFDQFTRAHAHLDDELGVNGMGLGLAIVRESMSAMNGQVGVVSEEGAGTTFVLEWPYSPPRE